MINVGLSYILVFVFEPAIPDAPRSLRDAESQGHGPTYKRQASSLTVAVGFDRINLERKTMSKYTLAQILEAWDAAYGEDMHEEYPGFIQRLSEETDKETDIKNLREQIKNEEN